MGKLIGGVNNASSGGKSTPLKGRLDIGKINVHYGGRMRSLDLRQAQGWLNNIQHIGITVGEKGNGQLVGSISNLDAVQNVYPDRDGVTLGTKCIYQMSEGGVDGGLVCS